MYTWCKNVFRIIAVLKVFLAANEKSNLMKTISKRDRNKTDTRQIHGSVTVSDVIARKIYTKKNKTGTGHQQYRDERVIKVATE